MQNNLCPYEKVVTRKGEGGHMSIVFCHITLVFSRWSHNVTTISNIAFVLPRNLEYLDNIKFIIPCKLSCHETFFNEEKKKPKLWLFVWWCWELKPTKKKKETWKLGDLSLTLETIPPTHLNQLDVTCSQGKQNIISYSIQNIQNFNTS
jgi:hypothetical protein